MFSVVNAWLQKMQTIIAAPISIVSSVYEGCLLPIDKGLRLRPSILLVFSWTRFPEYDQGLFNNKQSADKLRPPRGGKTSVKTLGMLGAGMMEQVLLWSAQAGMIIFLTHHLRVLRRARLI